jgi:acyl-CoA reductase-like NAD-dependent aldehyde dehydrogenase
MFSSLNTAERIAIASPDGSQELGVVEPTPRQGVPAAVAQARKGQPEWGERPVAERAAILIDAANVLEPQIDELGSMLAAESGKPLAQARFEVRSAVELLRANAELARRWTGTVLPTEGQPGTERDLAFTRREPLGVIAVVLPFNFPVELYVEKCAAALVGGNGVVVKPPLEDPLTVVRVHEALIASGIPSGVAQLVHGGAEVGAALAQADGVDAVSLTGSTSAGVSVACATAHVLRRLHLELGGNNAALVLTDADLDLVVGELAYGRLLMNGQACSASKRILVHHSLHDELAERLADVVRSQRVGSALEPQTTIGPLITVAAAARVELQVAGAVAQGASMVAGDGRAEAAYFPPCVLADVPVDADVAVDDEIFGPVFTVIPVADHDEALEVANSSSFGLMASVFSADLRLAVALAERLQAGGVVINGTDNYRPPVIPFGGTKMSGTGREGAGYTLAELTREKTIVLRRFRAPIEGHR